MAWYNIPGNEQDVVISTRYRLSRNIAEFPFPTRLDAASAKEIINRIGGVLEANGFNKTDFSEISHANAYSLAEKMYITPDFIRESLPHALYLNEPCNLSAMLCRREHIQLQCILPGFDLKDASSAVQKIEELLDSKFNFAYDERFGYLTSDPAYLGSGAEISVLLFLPALRRACFILPLSEKLSKCGMCLKSFFSESTESNIYILTNKITDVPQAKLVEYFSRTVREIIDSERAQRREIVGEEYERIADAATRAEGVLRYANLLSYSDFLKYSAEVRLGISLGMITDVKTELLTALLIESLPATLCASGDGATSKNRSSISVEKERASYVKERLTA
ncbi:MAG: hypothetical protein IJX74_01405 [Clostridia bacterium]|nr:hypothetical protein [Clostridia bacterium]